MKLSDELKVRCTSATKQRLQQAAKKSGIEFAEYVRSLLEAPYQAATMTDIFERHEILLAALSPARQSQQQPNTETVCALVNRLARVELIVEEIAMQVAPQAMKRAGPRTLSE